MNARILQLSAALALIGTSSATLASDWLWRDQVDARVDRVPASEIRLTGETGAARDHLWREQVPASATGAGSIRVVSGSAAADTWLWREQVELSARGAVSSLRVSDVEAETPKRQ